MTAWRVARRHNAGQLTTYFERPLYDIADAFGGERPSMPSGLDAAHELLDMMATESGASVRVERFAGHMGMFTLNHLQVHLRNNLIRQQNGLPLDPCVVSDEAASSIRFPPSLLSLYVVPQTRVGAPRHR